VASPWGRHFVLQGIEKLKDKTIGFNLKKYQAHNLRV
jgi:hypothetical protein